MRGLAALLVVVQLAALGCGYKLVGYAGALGGVNGSIIFKSPDGTEYFRLDPDGNVIEKGKRVTHDLAMYHALRSWLRGES